MDQINSFPKSPKISQFKVFFRSIINTFIAYYILFIPFVGIYTLFFRRTSYSFSFEDVITGLLPFNPYSLIIIVLFALPTWITNAIYAKTHPERFLNTGKKNFFIILFLDIAISSATFILLSLLNGGTIFTH